MKRGGLVTLICLGVSLACGVGSGVRFGVTLPVFLATTGVAVCFGSLLGARLAIWILRGPR